MKGTHYPIHASDFELAAAHFFNASTAAALPSVYPAAHFKYDIVRVVFVSLIVYFANRSATARLAAFLRDYVFAGGSRETARAFSDHGVPVFLYRFNVSLGNLAYELFGTKWHLHLVGICNVVEQAITIRRMCRLLFSTTRKISGPTTSTPFLTL